jgi:carboxyl-terminal processing protease
MTMNRLGRHRHQLVLTAFLALSIGFGAAFVWPASDDFFALKKNFTIFGKLYEELAAGYVDPLDAEQLMRTGIDAMLETLDPYTVFVDEAENEDLNILTQGRYGGVGLTVGRRAGKIVVLRPLEGYSGFEQGVRTGDVILTVDGSPTTGLAVADVSQLLRGEPGSTVRITVHRTGVAQPLDFVLTRARVQIKNISYSARVAENVGYARLDRFTLNATRELAEVIEDLQRDRPLDGLILDLRGNPGGLLEEAIGIAGLFLPTGSVIVSTRGRMAETERTYRSQGNPVAPDLPVAVLIDGYSASASEIVAGALQDHDRAVVLGEPTFGKGLVQIIRPLPYNTSLKLTVSRYYIPSGRSIQAVNYTRDLQGWRAETVPDSLRRAFRTAGGRTVFDGIGIEPDEVVSFGEVSELEEALVRQAAFFLYANHFTATRDQAPADFAATDAEMRAFRDWLASENFTYTTRSEQAIDDLAQTLDAAGYAAARDQVRDIRRAISADKEADFERHAPRIRERLRREILSRSLSQTAQIEATLPEDPNLARALELLRDPNAYRSVLAAAN